MNTDISRARSLSGLSQRDFAQALQISPRTLQEWEQGRRMPSGSAKALIKIAIQYPDIIRESFEALHHSKEEMAMLLEKMTDYLLAGEEIKFTDLILDWHRNDFECQLAPKPTKDNALKIALKASILERLVEVLNMPPHNRNQTPPAWIDTIKAIDEPMKLQSDRLLEDEDYCEAFRKRGFFVARNFMYFV